MCGTLRAREWLTHHIFSLKFYQRIGGSFGVFIYALRDIEIGEELTYDYCVASKSANHFRGLHSSYCDEPELACLETWTPIAPDNMSLDRARTCARMIVDVLPGVFLVSFDDIKAQHDGQRAFSESEYFICSFV